jgi:hypothetical protein
MKCFTLSMGISLLALGAYAGQSTIKFVPLKSYSERPILPPQLQAVFNLTCNQEFFTILRSDLHDAASQKVSIFVGALVKENSDLPCNDPSRDIVVDAGHAFSGRSYEVLPISYGR